MVGYNIGDFVLVSNPYYFLKNQGIVSRVGNDGGLFVKLTTNYGKFIEVFTPNSYIAWLVSKRTRLPTL